MRPKPHIRQDIKARPEPKLGRMIAVSFVVHLVALGLFSGVLFPRTVKPPKPVYIVDLVNLPVKDPQAGRPDIRPQKTSRKPKPKPKPDVVKLPPKPKPEPKPQPKPQPKPKPVVKSSPKPAVTKKDEQSLASALDKLKNQQKMEALRNKLAAMASQDTRKVDTTVPVGMPDAKGTQAGVSFDAWLKTYLTAAWRLSKYQVGRTDLEATVRLTFNAQGRLVDYKFIEESGDSRFDDSVKRAILQLEELPEPIGSRMEKEVAFNLKDLLQ